MTTKKVKEHVLRDQSPRVNADDDVPFGCEEAALPLRTEQTSVDAIKQKFGTEEVEVPAEVVVIEEEKTVDDELAKILADEPKEITEELLRRYRTLNEEIDTKTKAKAGLRETILRLAGKVDDNQKVLTVKMGKETLSLTRKNGSVDFDQEKYIKAMLSEQEWIHIKTLKKLVSEGKGTSVYMDKRNDSFDLKVNGEV